MDRCGVEYDIDACDAEYSSSETAILLSESLTIYDTDKKVLVHCRLVFKVIHGS